MNAVAVIEKSLPSGGTPTATVDVTVTTAHPLVTLLTMVAPSPDWFVGVSGLSLLDAQGDWLALHAVDLFPYDAGTDEGTEFSLSNAATDPQGAITSIKETGKFSDEPIATLTFTRQSVTPEITSETTFTVDEGTTAVATLTATDADAGSLTWSIPTNGEADAGHFKLSAPSHQGQAKEERDMSWTSKRYITAVFVIGLMWLAPPAVEAQSSDLFSTIDYPAALDSPGSHDASVVRSRVVTMDLGRLQRARAAASVLPRQPVHTKAVSPRRDKPDATPAPDATLTLNLFQDVVFTGIVDSTAPTFSGGYSISGRLVGELLGTLALVVNGQTVAGTVRTPGGTYWIRSAGDGLYAISQVELPPLECEVLGSEAGGTRLKHRSP